MYNYLTSYTHKYTHEKRFHYAKGKKIKVFHVKYILYNLLKASDELNILQTLYDFNHLQRVKGSHSS